jgi:hypothetical protein
MVVSPLILHFWFYVIPFGVKRSLHFMARVNLHPPTNYVDGWCVDMKLFFI